MSNLTHKKRWIAGNWKMNHGISATRFFFQELKKEIQNEFDLFTHQDIFLFPPSTSLSSALEAAQEFHFPISIGAQNAHFEKKGAYTGEISGEFLKELGVHHVLVGHSERRHILGETGVLIERKVKSLLDQDLHVLLCVGETQDERLNKETLSVLKTQLNCLKNLSLKNLMIAYEPVWAIGTGLAASPSQANEAHLFIKEELQCNIPILYGGSVTPENFDSFIKEKEIDGALIGGASLKAETFSKFLKSPSPV